MRRVLIVLLIAFWQAVLPATAQEHQPATVVGIVDGDTLRVQVEDGTVLTVRLTGIDTPETRYPSKPVQCFGPEASAKLAELIPPGTPVGGGSGQGRHRL